jgi:uncharacterized protein (TIGR02001 family)
MIALAALAAAHSTGALAADPLVKAEQVPGKFSGTVTFTNEYYFRGLSQTDDAPAIQGSLDYAVDLVKGTPFAGDVSGYLGIWGSNVDFNEGTYTSGLTKDGATLEVDLYGGIKGSMGSTGIGWDLGFIYYWYPGADSDLNYDYVEAKIALSYDFGFLSATASYNYSPDFFGNEGEGSGTAHYPKFAINVPVMGKVDLGAYIAKQYVEKNTVYGAPDYTEYNVSAKINVVGFDVSLAYSDTSIKGNVDGKGEAVLLAVGRTF